MGGTTSTEILRTYSLTPNPYAVVLSETEYAQKDFLGGARGKARRRRKPRSRTRPRTRKARKPKRSRRR